MTIEETINRMNATDSLSELCDMVLLARELIEKEYQKNKSRIFRMLNTGSNNDFFNFDAPMVNEDANANQHNSNASHDVGQRINVLEDDAVRRQAVLETLDDADNFLDEDRTIEHYKELLKECYEVLPPVNPQPRTGHWIKWYEQEEYDWIPKLHCKCSECDQEYDPYVSHFIKYCNECGAKMEEVKE